LSEVAFSTAWAAVATTPIPARAAKRLAPTGTEASPEDEEAVLLCGAATVDGTRSVDLNRPSGSLLRRPREEEETRVVEVLIVDRMAIIVLLL